MIDETCFKNPFVINTKNNFQCLRCKFSFHKHQFINDLSIEMRDNHASKYGMFLNKSVFKFSISILFIR